MDDKPDYSTWSHTQLVSRIGELEQRLKDTSTLQSSVPTTASAETALATLAPSPTSAPPKKSKSRNARFFDPSRYATRLIALKFAYLGQKYNGFEHHANNKTPLTTIEEELWRALMKTKLIFPKTKQGQAIESADADVSWEGCDYSKCGRTDKGVSAFGQVIGLRVRSNRPRSSREVQSSTSAKAKLEPLTSRKRSLDANYEPADPSQQNTKDPSLAQKVVEMEDVAMEDVPNDEPPSSFHPINDELPYLQLLNRVLPPDIRILAWCPHPPPSFSARFSCKERRYRYFFTQPAFAPVPGCSSSSSPNRDGWLDIAAMREAAQHYVGLHDFRNFCKVDPSKQITNFERRVFCADIEQLDPLRAPVGFVADPGLAPSPPLPPPSLSSVVVAATPAAAVAAAEAGAGAADSERHGRSLQDLRTSGGGSSETQARVPAVYVFNIDGSAFLWHQVRHLVAVLFLVGQGLEKPSVVADMLDVAKMPTKPHYDMASDAPLVLWDCIFPAEGAKNSREDALEWIFAGDMPGAPGSAKSGAVDLKYGRGGVVDDLWQIWRGRKMDEILAGTLIDVVAAQGKKVPDPTSKRVVKPGATRLFEGRDTPRPVGNYVPLLERRRMESVEAVNARYAARKGLVKTGAVVADDEANE